MDFKTKLSDEAYNVCFLKGTELRSGKYLHNNANGMYVCAVCGTKLFSSDTKYDSGTGWPAFWDIANKNSIKKFKIKVWEWNESKLFAQTVEAILATFLMMVQPTKQDCDIA